MGAFKVDVQLKSRDPIEEIARRAKKRGKVGNNIDFDSLLKKK